jgi:hypothetical protein
MKTCNKVQCARQEISFPCGSAPLRETFGLLQLTIPASNMAR